MKTQHLERKPINTNTLLSPVTLRACANENALWKKNTCSLNIFG